MKTAAPDCFDSPLETRACDHKVKESIAWL